MYVWSFDAVQQMTGAASPALATFWRNYILYSLGSAYSDSTNEVRDPEPYKLKTLQTLTLNPNPKPIAMDHPGRLTLRPFSQCQP